MIIIASNIVFNTNSNPRFLVCGQKGGCGGGSWTNNDGKNGEGGMIIIECPEYNPDCSQWDLGGGTYGNHAYPSTNGGHGVVVGRPQKVFINGKEYLTVNTNIETYSSSSTSTFNSSQESVSSTGSY